MNTLLTALTAITEHLSTYALTEPASVLVARYDDWHRVQLAHHALPELAAELLAWADTATVTSVEAWRAPGYDKVHVRATTELPGSVTVAVYGAVPYSAGLFPDLQPDGTQPVALSVLRSWAEDRATGGGVAA